MSPKDIPLAHIEEAITYAIANGWRPPTATDTEPVEEAWRSAQTLPAPPGEVERAEVAGSVYEALEFRHGLAVKLAVGS